jgi:hypothetical protein
MSYTEFGPRVRVEAGAARKTAIATEELLSNAATAARYQVGAKDALGKPIALGEPMTYLDDLAPAVWYVYQADATGRFLPAGEPHPTQAEAFMAAARLAASLEG